MYTYKIAGLRVSSEFEMNAPSLQSENGHCDVTIKFKSEIGQPQNPTLDHMYVKGHSSDLWFMGNEHLAFRIFDGCEIQIQAGPECSSTDINLFLIGSAFGVIAFQRGLVPFHCSAVELEGKTLAVTGQSGAGKSTLATALSKLGYAHFCDDVGIFDPAEKPYALRAMPKGIKLWDEAASQLEIEKGARVSSIPELLKTYIEPPLRSTAQSLKFERLYVISDQPANDFEITELTGMKKFIELRRAIYREEWFDAFFSEKEAFQLVVNLAENVQIFQFDRPRDLTEITKSAEFLLGHFENDKK